LPGPGGATADRSAIHARGVGVTYEGATAAAVADVEFDLPAGGCLLIVGPSGSGKSTLARAIAGMVPGSIPGRVDGELVVGGRVAGRDPQALIARQVGIVFQDPESQLVMERVDDEVAFGLESFGWSAEDMRSRVPEALGALGLAGFERRHTARLSGGEQQRLAIAGALAPTPGILVLDEPSANLDRDGIRELAARLGAMRTARSTTIVLVEHRADLVWPLADLVLALGADGRPIALGPPEALLERHVARLAAAGIWLPEAFGPRTAAVAPPDAPRAEAAAGPLLVHARGVGFAWDPARPVLRGIDLELAAGDRVAMLGPNGSGKSTLGRIVSGLLRPKEGSVRLAGRDPARLPARELARLVGFVFQDPEQQFVAPTVRAEMEAGLDATGRAGVAEVADTLGLPLEVFADRSPYTLSGGEQRRLSLAPALARRPGLLVLDEPTYGQDRHGYDRLIELFGARLGSGTAILVATHDPRLVADLGARPFMLGSTPSREEAA
jgi:energy-coupling factor transporter ATP-binding protein EcfA2